MDFKALADSVIDTINQAMGDAITYSPNGGSPISINAVFENKYVEVQSVVSLKPTLRIRLGDLISPPAKGDQVTIDTITYKVMESREDGFGGSTLIMQKL